VLKRTAAKLVVYNQVKKKAGLQHCKHIFVGSAPMHEDIFDFFNFAKISIVELYGLTECSGVTSVNFKSTTQSKPKSCGKPLNGVEACIIDCGADEHNHGEVKLHNNRNDFNGKFWLGFDSWQTCFYGLPWYGKGNKGSN